MYRLIITLIYLILCGAVQAQTACPSGVAPGSAQCGPSSEYHDVESASRAVTYQPSVPVVIKRKWADRWGTIAYDELNPIIGTSSGIKSKRAAVNTALSDCRSKGGKNCKVATAYYNQCVTLFAIRGGGLTWATGKDIKAAQNFGMEGCRKDKVQCDLIYSNCSMSEEYWERH